MIFVKEANQNVLQRGKKKMHEADSTTQGVWVHLEQGGKPHLKNA
jgi:hypothetical protein